MTIDSLIDSIEAIPDSRIDTDVVRKAYEVAERAHDGQTRTSGEPYIQHPLHVAQTLAQLKLDTSTIAAAILHDTLEDTAVTKDDIREQFGPSVLRLVEGVTKLNKVQFKQSEGREYMLENLRKMFLAMAADIRVVLIKLADRYHNMLTLDALPQAKQRRIAQETLNIYAPLANRLGIGELRSKLEDLSFPILFPKESAWTQKIFEEEISKKRDVLELVQHELRELLEAEGIEVEGIHGRIKGLYSLYRKLLRYNKNINKIYDLAALRIILPDIPSCYTALGLIHKRYKPLVGRIKDYISIPKSNGYQSLHTTVITPKGGIVELQLRTQEMHQKAEYGVIANWYYSEQGKPSEGVAPMGGHMKWVQQLAEWQREIQSSEEFEENLRIDVFKNRIFVFTPQGEVLDLPDGATAIDFAYAIHTSLGHSARSCKINRKERPLEATLQNGDVVDIITNEHNKEAPQRTWLSVVKTSFARRSIKEWLRKVDRKEKISEGHQLLDHHIKRLKDLTFDEIPNARRKTLLKTLNLKTEDDLFLALGQGDLSPRAVMNNIFKKEDIIRPRKRQSGAFGFPFGKEKAAPRAWIDGHNSLITHLAKNCKPSVGHDIKVIINRGEHKSAVIHSATCKKIVQKELHPGEEIVDAEWDNTAETIGDISIELAAIDRVGMLFEITNLIRKTQHNIALMHADGSKTREGTVRVYLRVELHSLEEADELLQKLSRVQGILSVKRIEKIPPLQ
ncbi:MAG: bifunctional (p)ppGpp synthetase/guanosine-3',5'-bis(diphosphate) 3'-pyrophosphohydrolase [Candidatus Doudnabacteria bacterium]|nr:bifunctional (p)ppGpp synthetase/guanosine-3',5'-bis(diphosphate) 3'-pyrophosphohydrolase [Candidatus Doudnabacteria bacterium]